MNPEWLVVAPLFDDVTVDTFDEAQDVSIILKKRRLNISACLTMMLLKGKL